MSGFNYETQEDKDNAKARAESLKPKVANVVATEMGWCVPQSNGNMEVLVRFHNLDSLLGDLEPKAAEIVDGPLEVVVPVEAETTKEESEEVSENPMGEEDAETTEPKKRGRKPKTVEEGTPA
jgi:hypothetical protein